MKFWKSSWSILLWSFERTGRTEWLETNISAAALNTQRECIPPLPLFASPPSPVLSETGIRSFQEQYSLPPLAPSFWLWGCLQGVQLASIGTFISMVASNGTVSLHWHLHFDGVFKWYSLPPLANSFQGYSVFKWYCLPPLAHSLQGYSVFKWYCLPPLAHSFWRCLPAYSNLPCGLVPIVVFVAAENASLQKYCELSRLEDGHYVMVWALFLVQDPLHLQSSHQFGWEWFGLLCLGNFPSP